MLYEDAVAQFLEYLELEQNRSQKTIQNYSHYLTRLADFAGEIKLADIDAELIRKWRLWLNRLGTNTSDELITLILSAASSWSAARAKKTVQFL
jgi:site-specific recombinase XerD